MNSRENDISINIDRVRHVYKGGNAAIDDVNLNISTGLFGLLGPNGAGKSTLMRIICSLLIPTSGHVTVGGFDVVKERRKVRTLLGYLPQEFNAWRLQRVEEVLDTLATLSGMGNRSERKRRVFDILESVGLLDVAHRKVKKLSGGMVRRLGVAQALIHEPRVLVVDEPTVGLDPEERIHFRQLMTKLGQDRIIILSTHIVSDLGPGCHDLALINKGKVEFRGSPEELINKAKGIVFEMSGAGSDDIENIEIVSREDNGHSINIRAVAKDGKIPQGGKAVDDPSLEEAYLAFMATLGKKIRSAGMETMI